MESKDGVAKILTGNHYIELEDETTHTFYTQDPQSFLEYIKGYKPENHIILYDTCTIKLVLKEAKRIEDPIAVCNLLNSNLFNHVSNNLGNSQVISDFEKWLSKLKKNLDETGVDLMFNVKDLKISKVTNIQRTADKKGNYIFNISRESKKDSGEYEPPESFGVAVPLYQYLDTPANIIPLDLDFQFDYNENHGDVKIYMSVDSPNIDDIVLYQQKIIVEEILDTQKFEKYFGDMRNHQHDNSWKYQDNGQNQQ